MKLEFEDIREGVGIQGPCFLPLMGSLSGVQVTVGNDSGLALPDVMQSRGEIPEPP